MLCPFASVLPILVASLSTAQDPAPTAATVTAPGRSLDTPLEVILGARERGQGEQRCLYVLLDPTTSLAASGFADAFGRALTRHRDRLGATRIGVARTGVGDPVLLAPTGDHEAVRRAVREALSAPDDDFHNVYTATRATAAKLHREPGTHEILLVTLDNGDAEDDLEATVDRLRKSQVELNVIASEAYVADSYWSDHPNERRPRGLTMRGGDAPVIDLPWGWILQQTVANEVTPAALAAYGLTRMAAASQGTVFLFTPPERAIHQCAVNKPYSECRFCSGDHRPHDHDYVVGAVHHLAPLVSSRREALRSLGADPYFRAVVRTWQRAAKAGLIRSKPPVTLQTSTAREVDVRLGRTADLLGPPNLSSRANKGRKAADECRKIADALEGELERIGEGMGMARAEATARLTVLMLRLTYVNLVSYVAWCTDVAPDAARHRDDPDPPEVPTVPPDRRASGITFRSMCLCHGVRPYLYMELPGGEELQGELVALDTSVRTFLEKYGQTQYGYALRRAGIARFLLTTYGRVVGNVKRPRTRSSPDEPPETKPPTRPTRGGPASTGAGGPTTGGKGK